jgi:PAS domain S-box-containing protein
VVLAYAIFASLWILLSDRAVTWMFRSPGAILAANSLKGLVFVVVTSAILYAVTRDQLRRLGEREVRNAAQEQERQRALQLLEALCDASSDAIFVKDTQGRYILVNGATARILGREPGAILGRDDTAVFPPAEAEAVRAGDRLVLEGGRTVEHEEVVSTAAGPATFLTVKGPILDASGRAYALFGTARDITQRKRIEDDLRASEQKFWEIFQMSPDAIDLTEMETGRILDCNQSYARLYGHTREEALGRTTPPGDLGVWVNAADRARHVAELEATGLSINFLAPMRSKDGTTFLAEISSSVLEIKGMRCNLSLSRDVTVQKRAEAALRESKQRLEVAIQGAHLGIWDRDLETDLEIWSDQLFEIYGRDPRTGALAIDAWERAILHSEDRAGFAAMVREAVAGRAPYAAEFRILRPDGSIRHIKSNGQVVRDPDGRPVRIIGVNQDRTAQVEAEAEHRRLQAELQQAEKLESIGSLAGGVAHDMNNVLAAILGLASALRTDFDDDDPRAASLDTITRACDRGRDVVKSLLYFARRDLEAMGPVDLNIILEEVVHLLTHTTLRRIDITKDFQEPLGLIEGDGGALSHALINLCVNAVDAMPEGGSLRLSTRREGGRIVVRVRDTGEGMSPEVARRSIEPFFTTKPVGKGTGLGLTMVYGAVKAHKGTIDIDSQPGRGTEVRLGFPALPQPAAGGPGPDPAQARTHGPLRILLVDDDELIRMSMGPMLGILGHEVSTAECGQEALDRLRAGLEADLVILDMNMPGLNGAQTLERLLEFRPNQQVLMATGYSDDTIAPLLAGRPNVTSLRKPFSLPEIREKLEQMEGLGA